MKGHFGSKWARMGFGGDLLTAFYCISESLVVLEDLVWVCIVAVFGVVGFVAFYCMSCVRARVLLSEVGGGLLLHRL